MSSGRERRLKFKKRRSVSFGGMYTKRYLTKFEKLYESNRKHIELSKDQELSSTGEAIIDKDLEEAQTDLTTSVLV